MRPVAALVALLLAACATGETVESEPVYTGGAAGQSGAAGAAGSGGGGAAGAGGAAASAGTGGGAGQAGGAGTAGSAGAGGTTCGSPNTCAGAEDLGTVSGDNGGVQSLSGTGSRFVKVRVTEDNHGILGEALEVKVALAVPAGADLDVYAYVNPDADVSACGTTPFASAAAGGVGQPEQLVATWGDGLTGSGSDDSRTLVLEVAHKAGSCESWTLTVQGNP